MSGDSNKKKNKVNPGAEFFYKLSLKPEFQNDLVRARRQLGIREEGFINPDTRKKMWIENRRADVMSLLGIEMHLKQKYEIPFSYWLFIDDYIFFGKPINALKNGNPAAIMVPGDQKETSKTENLESLYQQFGERYVKVFIFSNATQQRVLDFIKKSWREIEFNLNININKNSRSSVTIYKERILLIRELWRKPLNELQSEAGTAIRSRDLLVAKILVKRGITEAELSPGYIRKIANQK